MYSIYIMNFHSDVIQNKFLKKVCQHLNQVLGEKEKGKEGESEKQADRYRDRDTEK